MITIGLILRVLSVIAAAAIWSKDPGRRADAQEVLRMTLSALVRPQPRLIIEPCN